MEDQQKAQGEPISVMNCPICLEVVNKQDEIWMCYRCDVICHLRCIPTSNGMLRTVNGCPACGYTEEQAVKDALKPVVPPLGVWCSLCWRWVTWSEKVIKCPAPDDMCLGHCHEACFRGKCGACNLSIRAALRETRNRKAELFRTKM